MPIKVKTIDILKRHYCVHTDAYLVMGQRHSTPKCAPYIVGWIPRAPAAKTNMGNEILSSHHFMDIDSAQITFNTEMTDHELLMGAAFTNDHQQYAVYEWENNILIPAAEPIKRNNAAALVEQISNDYKMPVPKLIWAAHTNHSEYDECDHWIRFGHREKISLLHEMAHALYHERRDGDTYANHCPGFVWTAIELYHRYAGVDLHLLVSSAMDKKLLGDVNASQYIKHNCVPDLSNNDNKKTMAHKKPPSITPRPS